GGSQGPDQVAGTCCSRGGLDELHDVVAAPRLIRFEDRRRNPDRLSKPHCVVSCLTRLPGAAGIKTQAEVGQLLLRESGKGRLVLLVEATLPELLPRAAVDARHFQSGGSRCLDSDRAVAGAAPQEEVGVRQAARTHSGE